MPTLYINSLRIKHAYRTISGIRLRGRLRREHVWIIFGGVPCRDSKGHAVASDSLINRLVGILIRDCVGDGRWRCSAAIGQGFVWIVGIHFAPLPLRESSVILLYVTFSGSYKRFAVDKMTDFEHLQGDSKPLHILRSVWAQPKQ
jgi:hypothetical protein